MVYESLLLWPESWVSTLLMSVYFFIGLLNVVFTTIIVHE